MFQASSEAVDAATSVIDIVFDNLFDLIRTQKTILKVPDFANYQILADINLNNRGLGIDSLAGRKITRQIDEEPKPIETDQWNAAYLTQKGLHKRAPKPVIQTG